MALSFLYLMARRLVGMLHDFELLKWIGANSFRT